MRSHPLARAAVAALAVLLVAACATTARTSLDTSWADPRAKGAKFKKIAVVSVAADEFAQQYFQEQMAADLNRRGVNAVATRRYFTHRSPSEEARFKQAIDASGADAVILARVVGIDEKSSTRPGMLIAPNGVPYAETSLVHGAWAQALAPTHYVPPSDYSERTVLVETLLYDMKDRKAVWSARTRTTNATKGDLKPAVAQLVGVVVAAMERDGLF